MTKLKSTLRLLAVLALALAGSTAAYAGALPPTRPPTGGGPPCWPPPCIPVDNGLMYFMIAGALLGVYLLYRKHKLALQTQEIKRK